MTAIGRATRLVTAGLLTIAATALAATGTASATAPAATGAYHALSPTRILDTRVGVGAPQSPVAARGSISLDLSKVTGVAPGDTVVLNVTVTAPTALGYVTAYPDGSQLPIASNLNFVAGLTVANLTVVRIGDDDKVALYNGSHGTVELVADLEGYFAGSQNANDQGAFGALPSPTRLLDTRGSAGHGPVGAHQSVSFALGNTIPPGVSAVVLNVTVANPSALGYISAYADGGAKPSSSNLNFVPGQIVPNLVVAPVGADGKVALYNGSSGTVQLIADAAGYFAPGDPVAAGAFGALAPSRVLDTRYGTGAPAGALQPGQAIQVQVGGLAGVPKSGVTAAVLNVTAVSPSTYGYLTVYAGGGNRPSVSNLNFTAGQIVPNLVLAPLSAAGTVTIYNGSRGTVQVLADVSGYVRAADAPLPQVTSTSRYVRNISGAASDVATMMAEGQSDAASGSKLVVLDIGAQLNNKSGVQLSATATNLTYAQLVTAVQGYLDGFGSVSGATVAVGTNNEGDFAGYPASGRGADWANKVIDQLVPGAGVTVAGADDIEADFASTEPQAEQWESSYLASTSQNLIFTGAADGCPTEYGASNGTCNYGWTEAQHYRLAGGLNPARIQALPQIYLPVQAVQWANIFSTGGRGLTFLGALTEYAACPTASSPGCNFAALTPAQGWAALYHALSTVVSTPSLPSVTDLRVDG